MFWYGSLTPLLRICNNHLHTLAHTLGEACTTHCMYLTSCNSCQNNTCKHTQRQAATGLLRLPNSCTTHNLHVQLLDKVHHPTVHRLLRTIGNMTL